MNMPRLIHALCFLLLTASLAMAAPAVFRWTDPDGQVHYGHAVPPEFRSLGYERLAPDGRVIERIAPEMTPEERAAQAARLAMQAELEAEQATQAARDRLLLMAYRNEQDLVDNREARLEAMRQQRRGLETSHRHAVQRFEDLVARAASLSRDSQTVPQTLENSVTATQDEVRRLRAAKAEMDERMAAVEEQFDRDLQRYRSLTQRTE